MKRRASELGFEVTKKAESADASDSPLSVPPPDPATGG